MPDIKLTGYYNKFDPAKNYDRVLMRAARTAQSAEQNEIQSIMQHRLRGVTDALFKDGDIIRGARISYDPDMGVATCEEGQIYLAGAVRSVPARSLMVPTSGVVAIGVFLLTQIVLPEQDPDLYNPAVGTKSEGEPGAARLQINPQWGLAGDEVDGDFYPVQTLEDGNLQAKEPPPNLDIFTQSLARYDRNSTGGTYVVTGLDVRKADNTPEGYQSYTVSEGRAQVFGFAVELGTSRRIVYPTQPELLPVEAEPHLATGEPAQFVTLNRYPAASVTRIRITREIAITVTHGGYTGAADPLPHTSVMRILEVSQGDIVFVAGTDYQLAGGKVDWSLGGAEPSPYSTYTVTYQYFATVDSPANELNGLVVTDAVAGSEIFVDYFQSLPRLDVLCLDQEGFFLWVTGVPNAWAPQKPYIPDTLLALATVYQTWDGQHRVINDGTRMVPMEGIVGIYERLDDLTERVAQHRLEADIFTREAGAKKGLFVDPFLSDEMRDQGLAQTAAVVDGYLTLPVSLSQVATMPNDVTAPRSLDYVLVTALEQLARTGDMLINPYMARDPLPAIVHLNPAIDRWTEVQTNWTSAITHNFGWGNRSQVTSVTTETVSSSYSQLEYLRPINVSFDVTGFGPGETLTSLTFDDLPVTSMTTVADSSGRLQGAFTIPAGIPAGTKSVRFTGSGGSWGAGTFVGQGVLNVQVLRSVTNVSWWYVHVDPLAQSFVLTEPTQLAAIELWFTARGTSRIIIQIRDMDNGLPGRTILAEAFLEPGDLKINSGFTRAAFTSVATLQAETEYCVVIMCDDATTAVAVAELGKWDYHAERWVTAQPYQIGVLYSSSNASAWTAHQTFDLTFRLLKAQYTQISAEVDLGDVDVEDVSDLLLLPVGEQPAAQARLEYGLTLPNQTKLTVADGQTVRLDAPISGKVGVMAKLMGSAAVSPVLHPGTTLVCGTVATTGDYISRGVPAGQESQVKIILDADLPAGSAVQVEMAPDATPGESPLWAEAPFESSRPLDDGWQELIFLVPTDALLVRTRIILTGNSAARPRVDNLRILTI